MDGSTHPTPGQVIAGRPARRLELEFDCGNTEFGQQMSGFEESAVDADEQYILDKLTDGFERSPRQRAGRDRRGRSGHPSRGSTPLRAVPELLDEYEAPFYREGAFLDTIQALGSLWRETGLTPAEMQQWVAAGVHDYEPQLAVAMAAAGFTPRQASQKIRTRGGSFTPISYVRASRKSPDEAAGFLMEKFRDAENEHTRAG